MNRCAKCGNVLIGRALSCMIHGDQLDIGGRAPVVESAADQRRGRLTRLDPPAAQAATLAARAGAGPHGSGRVPGH